MENYTMISGLVNRKKHLHAKTEIKELQGDLTQLLVLTEEKNFTRNADSRVEGILSKGTLKIHT